MKDTTFIISNPDPIKQRLYRSTTPKEQQSIKEAHNATRDSLLAFLQAAAGFCQTGWAFEWVKNDGFGDSYNLLVNGQSIHYKFAEKWVYIHNNAYSQRELKVSTQLYYDKPLSLSIHGKKAVEAIQAYLDKQEQARIVSMNRDNNIWLHKQVMDYLVDRHGFVRLDERTKSADDNGWRSQCSETTIEFQYRLGESLCTFVHTVAEKGSLKMKIRATEHDHSLLTFNGTYMMGSMSQKYHDMKLVVVAFEREFMRLFKLLPEAIAAVKNVAEKA